VGFQEQTLDQVARYFRTVTGLEFHITPLVRTTRFDDVRITVPPLDDVSIEWMLENVVTTPYGLRWEVRDGVVTIATPEEVRGPMRLKYIDVRSLVSRVVTVRGTDGKWEPREVPEPLLSAEALLDRIRNRVHPESWSDDDASLDVKNGTLIVKNQEATIERVGRFVAELRDARVRWTEDNTPPAPSPPRATLWKRSWSVVDLVGRASGDGTIEPGDGSATAPAYAPGALVALLRVSVESDLTENPVASIELVQGTLRLHLNWSAIVRVERLLRELRARGQPAPAPSDFEVGFSGPSNVALAR